MGNKKEPSKTLSPIEKKFFSYSEVRCPICEEIIHTYIEGDILYSETKRKSILFFHAACVK